MKRIVITSLKAGANFKIMNRKLVINFLLAWILTISGFSQSNVNLNDWLMNNHCQASLKIVQHDYNFFNRPESHKTFVIGNPGDNREIVFQGEFHTTIKNQMIT